MSRRNLALRDARDQGDYDDCFKQSQFYGFLWSGIGLMVSSLLHLRLRRSNSWYKSIGSPQRVMFGLMLPVGGYVTASMLTMIRCGQRKSFIKAYESILDEDLSIHVPVVSNTEIKE